MDVRVLSMKTCLLIPVVLAVFFLMACGVKAPIKPPLSNLPKAPGNLAMRQIGSSFLVSWTLPKINEDGSPAQLQGFNVFKTRYELSSSCPECHESVEVFRHLDLEFLQRASRRDDMIFFRDFDLIPESGYRYKVVPLNRKGRQGDAAVTQKPLFLPPSSPENLRAQTEKGSIVLNWTEPAAETAMPGFIGYNIYRRAGDSAVPLSPINKDYWIDTAYTDSTADAGKTYTYTLRSVWRMNGIIVESQDSEAVTTALP